MYLLSSVKFEEQRIENWQRDWAARAEFRVLELRKHLEAVLANPDTPPERALQRQLQARDERHADGVPVS